MGACAFGPQFAVVARHRAPWLIVLPARFFRHWRPSPAPSALNSPSSRAIALPGSLCFRLASSATGGPRLRTLTAAQLPTRFHGLLLDQTLGLLVPTSSTHCCAYTVGLSPGSLPGALLPFWDGNLLLEGGFTLRCLQRLSLPYFASLLCRWHDNSCTSGTSIPVLSY